MITLALDEFGYFENHKNDDKPVGIAGILYDDDNNNNDLANERRRIENYYRACISYVEKTKGPSAELKYPAALHSNGSKDRDSKIVKPVKKRINATIAEFLRCGTYEGKELLHNDEKRNGKYYLFGIVKSDRGMNSLLGGHANFLTDDDCGSNLYFHMASEVINRMIFHNPIIPDIKQVSMNIASRRSEDMDKNCDPAQDYYKQGYTAQQSTNPKHPGQVYFGVANSDIYRTVLSQELIRAEKTEVIIEEFFVKSIKYVVNAKKMEFLYLSDSVCTFLSNDIKGASDSEKLCKIVNKSNQIIGKTHAIIFGYDEIDVLYQKTWSSYEQGDYYECLSNCYESKLKEGGYSDYYRTWFEHIRSLIIKDSDEGKFTRAVRRLHDTIKTNSFEQDKAVFILNTLEKMSSNVEEKLDDTESRDVFYTLYDIGVSAYCHIGDSKKTIAYYNKCKQFASRVGVEEYLETLNKMSETLLDNFEWEKAKQVANESVKYQEELLAMKNALPVYAKSDNETSVGLAKAYSQKAQVYAFMKDSKALRYFEKAMESFDKESADYRITQSYLLHYYLDNGLKDSYRQESKQYFGGEDDLEKQFSFILNESFKETPILNYKYALYVFIRGIYCFRMEELSDHLKQQLYEIDVTIKKAEIKSKGKDKASFSKLLGHPSEIIFKYLSMIAYEENDINKSDEFAVRINQCIGYSGPTIELIRMYGNIEMMMNRTSSTDIDKELVATLSYMVDSFEVFKHTDVPYDIGECDSLLQKKLTFMFH